VSIVAVAAQARIPTIHGRLRAISFSDAGVSVDDIAIAWEDRAPSRIPRVRVHSECLTGDVLHSLRCDCRDQLELGLCKLAEDQLDLILYLRQEGRGIGLGNKIRAYSLQDKGLDTVEANLHLGFEDDCRDYSRAAGMLKALGIERIVLYTNNPHKVEGLTRHGIECVQRSQFVTAARSENIEYLRTKAAKSGHWINLPGVAGLNGDPLVSHRQSVVMVEGTGRVPSVTETRDF
jgi:GTP cyclohydrolase II